MELGGGPAFQGRREKGDAAVHESIASKSDQRNKGKAGIHRIRERKKKKACNAKPFEK